MKKGIAGVIVGSLLLLPVFAVGAQGQTGEDIVLPGGPFRLLIVDETKGLEPTVRVGILGKLLQESGMMDVSVLLADVASGYDDPLESESIEKWETPYDIILILSKGIDDGTVPYIWIVFGGFETWGEAIDLEAGMEMLGLFRGIIDQVFEGIAEAVDMTGDLYPVFQAALYRVEGWLR
jgi:hypothetical protein